MTTFQTFIAAFAAVVLFLYGLQGFSRELQAVGGTVLRSWLGRVTASRWRGFAIGAAATAVVQSSGAVSSLAAALVDASVITFGGSLGILLGANVGTTATAWLVSFKLTGIGSLFIVLGALLSALPLHIRVMGKAVFYFGLIFFALDLIASGLKPLQSEAFFVEGLAAAVVPWKGVLAGLVFTTLVQSSSVTTGLAILLVQQGMLPVEGAIPVVIGANMGSTTTALLAGLGMSRSARATALANLLFNVAGVALFFPFIRGYAAALILIFGTPDLVVAWAHLIFNLAVAALFLAFLPLLEPFLRRWLGADRAVPAADPAPGPDPPGPAVL
jgi:phosphate:Na+ symporter